MRRKRQIAVIARCAECDSSSHTAEQHQAARERVSQDRQSVIDAILAASRRPEAEIVPVRHVLCSDGQYRSVHGIPFGVGTTGEFKTMGYVFRAADGVTYGTMTPTADALREKHLAGIAREQDEFRQCLIESDDERLTSQAAHWLNNPRIR